MIYVKFTKDCHLPRFKMHEGEMWKIKKSRLTDNGFTLGGGWVENSYYESASEKNNFFNVGTQGHIDY